jgi:UDP-N-acetylglucosamine 2-epimerase (non-hydrolysing)
MHENRDFDCSVVTTGQHREMLDQVLDFFRIVPDVRLEVMKPEQSVAELTSRLLSALPATIADLQPDVVLVHGDTMTTLGGALSAFYTGVPVGHVEAGLRTRNLLSPWPEESNRRLTSALAAFHFAPTERAKMALVSEGHSSNDIWVTGNTVIDALADCLELLGREKEGQEASRTRPPIASPGKRLILVTGHRRENFDQGLAALCDALLQLSQRNDVEVIFPVHLNPVVQRVVNDRLANRPAIRLVPPMDYPTFVLAMRSCDLILTDSGGIQEEAPSLGKPVLVMRDTTERPEGIEAGTVRLIGMHAENIVRETTRLLDDSEHYRRMAAAKNPYGDGRASERIISALKERLLAAR